MNTTQAAEALAADRLHLLENLRAEEARHLDKASRFSRIAAYGFPAARGYATYHRNKTRALREAINRLESSQP